MVAEIIVERYKKSRLEAGIKIGLEQGRQEAAAQQKAWEDWNRRREQAAANNQSFTEPPPTFNLTPNGH